MFYRFRFFPLGAHNFSAAYASTSNSYSAPIQQHNSDTSLMVAAKLPAAQQDISNQLIFIGSPECRKCFYLKWCHRQKNWIQQIHPKYKLHLIKAIGSNSIHICDRKLSKQTQDIQPTQTPHCIVCYSLNDLMIELHNHKEQFLRGVLSFEDYFELDKTTHDAVFKLFNHICN